MRITDDKNSENNKLPVVGKEKITSCPSLSEKEEKKKIEEMEKEPFYIAFGGKRVYLSKKEFKIFKEDVNSIKLT